MKITKEQAEKNTKEKMAKKDAMLAELQIGVSAEEIVLSSGLIKKVVMFSDNEKYDIEEPVVETPSVETETPTIDPVNPQPSNE